MPLMHLRNGCWTKARKLRAVVDYDEVHRRVLAYDKASFRAWRERGRKVPFQGAQA